MNEQVTYTALVADDHEMLRDGLVKVLSQLGNFEVLGAVNDGLSAIATVKVHKPDLLILDIAMPYAQGMAVYEEVKRWSPDTKVVIFSGITSSGLLTQLKEAGVSGIFTKRSNINELKLALPRIMAGDIVISNDAQSLIDDNTSSELTSREKQILSLIANGSSNKEIAETLGISPKTVDNHRTKIMAKLEVHSIAELLAYALREGLLDYQNQL